MAYRLYDDTSKVDSEDCAAPSPGPLPATSNVSLYIGPVRAVAPTAVLNSGKIDRVGPQVHANTLSHHLGIFRRNLAAPLRWLSCSFPLDSSPDSGSLDPHAPSASLLWGASPLSWGSLSLASASLLNCCVPLHSLSSSGGLHSRFCVASSCPVVARGTIF